MNLLKSVTDEIYNFLVTKDIDEFVDLRISNIDGFDYQINNLVKYQNHSDIQIIKDKISEILQSSNMIEHHDFAQNLFINFKVHAELLINDLKEVKKIS